MKKLILLAMAMVFCLVGSVQAQVRPQPQVRTPRAGEEMAFTMGPGELETANKILIDNGYKNLVPVKGIIKGPGDLVLQCAKPNGGLVRVEVKWNSNDPGNKARVKVFE